MYTHDSAFKQIVSVENVTGQRSLRIHYNNTVNSAYKELFGTMKICSL